MMDNGEMTGQQTSPDTSMNRRQALRKLGLCVSIAYASPVLLSLDTAAHASGGGGSGGGGSGGGTGGGTGGGESGGAGGEGGAGGAGGEGGGGDAADDSLPADDVGLYRFTRNERRSQWPSPAAGSPRSVSSAAPLRVK